MNEMKEGRHVAVWLCAALFVIFGLSFLGCHERYLLATAQWVSSRHQTIYMPLAGPLILVGLLGAVSVLVSRIVRPWPAVHAAAYAPSFLLMSILAGVSLPVADGESNGWGWISLTLAALVLSLVLWLLWRISSLRSMSLRTSLPVTVACNMGIMAFMMAVSTQASNTCTHLHMALKMSSLASEGRYDELLKVGEDTPECSRSISAMRAYALSREGLLADKLFSYPQHHGALGLIPPQADSSHVFDWPRELYRHLGSVCCEDVCCSGETLYYLRQVAKRHPGRVQADYLLCAYLLERRLDDFATELQRHYTVTADSLPRHYKEALVVYQRRSATPKVEFHDAETEANLAEFLKLRARFSDPKEQEFHLIDMYAETYWCYYYYRSRKDK